MAEVLDLQGRERDADHPLADPRISNVLSDLRARNRAGRVKAIAVAWIDDKNEVYDTIAIAQPVGGALLLGAVQVLRLRAEREAADYIDDEPFETDGEGA